MTILDWLLIGGIALAVVLALRVCIRNHADGKNCTGDCAHCGRSCRKS